MLASLLTIVSVFGQTQSADLEGTVGSLSVRAVAIGSIVLIVLVVAAVLFVKKQPKLKKPLFILIVLTVLSTTGIISGGTIYLNAKSASGGPVHWHADIEFWACGNELELRDPSGALSNKIGTPTLHEHNDKRIHLEGVPVDLPHDASLGKFMEAVGGGITAFSLLVPLNDQNYFANTPEAQDGDGPGAPNPGQVEPYITDTGSSSISDLAGAYKPGVAYGKYATFLKGFKCGDQPAEVQLFAYRYNQADKTYQQTKIADPASYEISHESQVPPGDCLIVEFAPAKDHTNKLCKQYGVRDADRCQQFGVAAGKRHICNIREQGVECWESTDLILGIDKTTCIPLKQLCQQASQNPYTSIREECVKLRGAQ